MVLVATMWCGSDSWSMPRTAESLLAAALAIAVTGCGLQVEVSVPTTAATTTVSSAGTEVPPEAPSPTGTDFVPGTEPPSTASTTMNPTSGAPSSSASTTPLATDTPATAPATTLVDTRPLAMDLLATVRVEREHRGGYERELFGYPTSFGGGCDTRDEVLQRDSLSPVQMDPVGCTVVAGDWYSPYDDLLFETPQDIEIDHVVALKEAWDSGAWQWGAAALEAFGNDVSDARTLRAVSGESNRDKSDKDPSNWLPSNAADVCRFVGDWTAIKVRWGLSMDESEYGRIRNLLRGPCEGWRVDAVTPTPVQVP